MLMLTFQVGKDHLALDVRRVHEIVPYVRLQPVACSPPWLTGVFVYRGQAVPVVDLHRLLGAGECPIHLSTRIILVPHGREDEPSEGSGTAPSSVRGRLVGLLAANVADIREMQPLSAEPARLGPGSVALATRLGPVFVDGQEIVHLVELDRLLPEISDETGVGQAAGLPHRAKESPA